MNCAEGCEAFFLPAEPGFRFGLYLPPCSTQPRGGVLYCPPFAEEMNKSRRMAALQARAFAKVGYGVLLLDLYGCGDSSGDFSDARWEVWKRDLALAAQWLESKLIGAIHLWGLRLGANLALDLWNDDPGRFDSALLWQPVASGETYLSQFLRLAVAGEALRRGGGLTTDSLRNRLKDGESIEVAGYMLAPAMTAALDRQKLANWRLADTKIYWLEIRGNAAAEPSLGTQQQLAAWREQHVNVHYQAVAGAPFWATQEIVVEEALIQVTTDALLDKSACTS